MNTNILQFRKFIFFIVIVLCLSNTKASFCATKCDASGKRCAGFSWSTCSGTMIYNGSGGHTKYVYCNKCGGLVMVQQGYGSCVMTPSVSYSSNNNGTHKKTTVNTCCEDSNDGTKWGGCGHSESSSVNESCNYTTKTVGNTKVTYCTDCGYIKSTETIQESSSDDFEGDSDLLGKGCIITSISGNRVSGSYSVEMWHYSTGYWNIGDYAGNREKVYDSTVGSLLNIDTYLDDNYHSLVFRIPYPDEVKSFVSKGKSNLVSYDVQSSNGMTILSSSLEKDGLLLIADCRYNVSLSYSMSDFVSGLKKDIPIVESPYGCNLYAIYKNAKSQGAGTGLFEGPSSISSPYIHPSEIANSKGNFKSGYSILVNGIAKSSAGYNVGWQTFSNAGAIGLEFDFPFSVNFTVKSEESAATTDSGQTGSGNSGSNNSGATTDSGTKNSDSSVDDKPDSQDDPVTPINQDPSENNDGNTGSESSQNDPDSKIEDVSSKAQTFFIHRKQ